MPPSSTAPESIIRYLTRLLAAKTLEAGGELRIPMKFIRQLERQKEQQILVEDVNTESEEVVLRFGTSNSAVYPVKSEQCDSPKLQSPTSTVEKNSEPEPKVGSRLPQTEEELNRIQKGINRRRSMLRMENEKKRQESFDLSGVSFPN